MSNMQEEKEKLWREEFEKYILNEEAPRDLDLHRYTNKKYDDYIDFDTHEAWLAYRSGRKAGQEEIDIENSIIKEYREQCILNAEELTTIRANHEEFARKMGDEIHARNNHVRELKKEIHRLKDLVKRAKEFIDIRTIEDKGCTCLRCKWLKDSEILDGDK